MPARHVVSFGGLVHHLIHGQRQEIAEHDVDHGSQARHRSAHANSGKASFGNWRIDYSFGAEFFYQPGKHFERGSCLGHVFAENANA